MEDLPPRPRRKLITPPTLGLAAVAIAAGGFIGGVEVQKHQGGGSGKATGSSLPAAFASRFRGGGAGPASGDFTTGTVANKHGSTLYVKDQSGTTIRVKTKSSSKVTRTASSSPRAVHPGDTVIVTGAKHSDGSITASSIRATSKAASSSSGGGGNFFGGAGPPAGAGGATLQVNPGG
jgi:hypothetical protein